MNELNLMNLLLFLASQNSSGGSGGGGTSVYIPNCSIDENGDLIVTLSDGTVMNAGNTGTEEDFLNSLKGEKEILVKPELQELMEKMVHKDLKVMMESHQL